MLERATGKQANWVCWIFTLFPEGMATPRCAWRAGICDCYRRTGETYKNNCRTKGLGPGYLRCCASYYLGTAPLLFRDMLPNWVPRARLTAKSGLPGSNMTFRQNDLSRALNITVATVHVIAGQVKHIRTTVTVEQPYCRPLFYRIWSNRGSGKLLVVPLLTLRYDITRAAARQAQRLANHPLFVVH